MLLNSSHGKWCAQNNDTWDLKEAAEWGRRLEGGESFYKVTLRMHLCSRSPLFILVGNCLLCFGWRFMHALVLSGVISFTISTTGRCFEFFAETALIIQRCCHYCWAGFAQDQALFSSPHLSSERVCRDLGWDRGKIADPQWSQGYHCRHHSQHTRRKCVQGVWSDSIFLPKSLLCVMDPLLSWELLSTCLLTGSAGCTPCRVFSCGFSFTC